MIQLNRPTLLMIPRVRGVQCLEMKCNSIAVGDQCFESCPFLVQTDLCSNWAASIHVGPQCYPKSPLWLLSPVRLSESSLPIIDPIFSPFHSFHVVTFSCNLLLQLPISAIKLRYKQLASPPCTRRIHGTITLF